MHTQVPTEARRGHQISQSFGYRWVAVSSYRRCWELNWGPFEEQQAFLTAVPAILSLCQDFEEQFILGKVCYCCLFICCFLRGNPIVH